MQNEAQMALRRGSHFSPPLLDKNSPRPPAVIEKYTPNARFCLICNYVGKIIPALQSRCTKFRFGPLNPKEARNRVMMILQHEKFFPYPNPPTPAHTPSLLTEFR